MPTCGANGLNVNYAFPRQPNKTLVLTWWLSAGATASTSPFSASPAN